MLDDDPGFHHQLAEAIQAIGCRVESSATSAAALERLRRTPPDAVFVNLDLPDNDGWEFVRQYQSQSSGLYIPIAVLASTRREAAIAARQLGVQAYLRKPPSLASLLRTLEYLMQLPPPRLLRISI